MGHIFPLYFGFKGGKGVLTSWAIIALIDWRAFVLVIVVFIIVFLCSRIVSLASICAAGSFPVFTLILNFFVDYLHQSSAAGPTSLLYVCSTFIIAALQASILIYKHRANIQRLRAGEEKKISIKKKKSEFRKQNCLSKRTASPCAFCTATGKKGKKKGLPFQGVLAFFVVLCIRQRG